MHFKLTKIEGVCCAKFGYLTKLLSRASTNLKDPMYWLGNHFFFQQTERKGYDGYNWAISKIFCLLSSEIVERLALYCVSFFHCREFWRQAIINGSFFATEVLPKSATKMLKTCVNTCASLVRSCSSLVQDLLNLHNVYSAKKKTVEANFLMPQSS